MNTTPHHRGIVHEALAITTAAAGVTVKLIVGMTLDPLLNTKPRF